MSAALPIEEQLSSMAKDEFTHRYKGTVDGDEVYFYFNTNSNVFLCEATIKGKEAKMVGDLIPKLHGVVDCVPKYGVQPHGESSEWVSTEGEEIKTIDISKDKIDFEGQLLTKF